MSFTFEKTCGISLSCKPSPSLRMWFIGKIYFANAPSVTCSISEILGERETSLSAFRPKTKGKPLFFYQVSHQMFDSSSSPEGTVSQAKCHQVTKSLGRERLDLFHFVLKALYKLLYTCNSGISIHKHMHSLYFVHGFI